MRKGFSLVELSIVLVILGLLTGGILSGQSLIHAAELRSVSTDAQRYQGAVYTFRDKYMALPGDMRNATQFWGDNNTHCPDAAIANGTPGVCNGNGNGQISDITGTYNPVPEVYQTWLHLSMAGLVEGTYTGIDTGGEIGANAPKARIGEAGWSLRSLSSLQYGKTRLNFLEIASIRTGLTPVVLGGGMLTAEDAWNIDSKMDDGKADTGKVLGVRSASSSVRDVANACTTNQWTADTADYVLTDTGKTCRLQFLIQ